MEYSYNPETAVFEIVFHDKEGVIGPTDIFTPEERVYPQGWTVEVSDPAGTWPSTWDPDRQILSVTTNSKQAEHTIRVLPTDH